MNILVLLAALMLASGCQTGSPDDLPKEPVKPSKKVTKTSLLGATGNTAGEIFVTVTAGLTKKINNRFKLNTQRIAKIIHKDLAKQGMITMKPDPELPSVHVVIRSMEFRSAMAAGFHRAFSCDNLIGDLSIAGKGIPEADPISIETKFCGGLSFLAGSGTRLNFLYNRLSFHVVSALTGVEPASAAPAQKTDSENQ